jgi:hypothetical protein
MVDPKEAPVTKSTKLPKAGQSSPPAPKGQMAPTQPVPSTIEITDLLYNLPLNACV